MKLSASILRINKTKLQKIAKEGMKKEGIDAWIIFTREANEDPLADEVGLGAVTWRSAGIITPEGNFAVVGSFDVKQTERTGIYDEVYGYGSEGPVDELRRLSRKLDLKTVAINESQDFPLADGLSAGLKKFLKKYIQHEKLVSSEDLVIDLRGRLLPEEILKVKAAVKKTEEILDDAQRHAIKEGALDREIFEYVQAKTREAGAGFSWPESMNPSLNVGTTPAQHSGYDNLRLKRGQMFRIDFGIRLDGYCSDLQRVYFVGPVPKKMNESFAVARNANDAAIRKLRPSVTGYDVDKAGRDVVLQNGFKDFAHGLGHTIARTAHEIGPALAPRWRNRYGHAMDKKIGRNIAFTIEPTINSEFGAINIEQDVLVDDKGSIVELSKPMTGPISV